MSAALNFNAPWTGYPKNENVKISQLQIRHRIIEKDRLSNKLNRRDVAYFDLYALHDPKDEYAQIRSEGGLPHTKGDMKIKELYGELAYNDFNDLFKRNGDILRKQYGQTIKVKLKIDGGKVVREVTQDFSNKKQLGAAERQEHADSRRDNQIDVLDNQMRNLSNEFDKTHD